MREGFISEIKKYISLIAFFIFFVFVLNIVGFYSTIGKIIGMKELLISYIILAGLYFILLLIETISQNSHTKKIENLEYPKYPNVLESVPIDVEHLERLSLLFFSTSLFMLLILLIETNFHFNIYEIGNSNFFEFHESILFIITFLGLFSFISAYKRQSIKNFDSEDILFGISNNSKVNFFNQLSHPDKWYEYSKIGKDDYGKLNQESQLKIIYDLKDRDNFENKIPGYYPEQKVKFNNGFVQIHSIYNLVKMLLIFSLLSIFYILIIEFNLKITINDQILIFISGYLLIILIYGLFIRNKFRENYERDRNPDLILFQKYRNLNNSIYAFKVARITSTIFLFFSILLLHWSTIIFFLIFYFFNSIPRTYKIFLGKNLIPLRILFEKKYIDILLLPISYPVLGAFSINKRNILIISSYTLHHVQNYEIPISWNIIVNLNYIFTSFGSYRINDSVLSVIIIFLFSILCGFLSIAILILFKDFNNIRIVDPLNSNHVFLFAAGVSYLISNLIAIFSHYLYENKIFSDVNKSKQSLRKNSFLRNIIIEPWNQFINGHFPSFNINLFNELFSLRFNGILDPKLRKALLEIS